MEVQMARINKTQFAILGCLSMKPMSGYDIQNFTKASIGYFWQEGFGQIYPVLKRLLAGGLVSRKTEPQEGKPDRHVYSLTTAGKEKLLEWLTEETNPQPVRNEFLLKIFFSSNVGPSSIGKALQKYLEQQKSILKVYQQLQKHLREHEANEQFPYWFTTLKFGIYLTRARMRWCKETLDVFSQLQEEKNNL